MTTGYFIDIAQENCLGDIRSNDTFDKIAREVCVPFETRRYIATETRLLVDCDRPFKRVWMPSRWSLLSRRHTICRPHDIASFMLHSGNRRTWLHVASGQIPLQRTLAMFGRDLFIPCDDILSEVVVRHDIDLLRAVRDWDASELMNTDIVESGLARRMFKRCCPLCWQNEKIMVLDDEFHLLFSCSFMGRNARSVLWSKLSVCKEVVNNSDATTEENESSFITIMKLVSDEVIEAQRHNRRVKEERVRQNIERYIAEKKNLIFTPEKIDPPKDCKMPEIIGEIVSKLVWEHQKCMWQLNEWFIVKDVLVEEEESEIGNSTDFSELRSMDDATSIENEVYTRGKGIVESDVATDTDEIASAADDDHDVGSKTNRMTMSPDNSQNLILDGRGRMTMSPDKHVTTSDDIGRMSFASAERRGDISEPSETSIRVISESLNTISMESSSFRTESMESHDFSLTRSWSYSHFTSQTEEWSESMSNASFYISDDDADIDSKMSGRVKDIFRESLSTKQYAIIRRELQNFEKIW